MIQQFFIYLSYFNLLIDFHTESNGHESNGHESNGHEKNGHEKNGHEKMVMKVHTSDKNNCGTNNVTLMPYLS